MVGLSCLNGLHKIDSFSLVILLICLPAISTLQPKQYFFHLLANRNSAAVSKLVTEGKGKNQLSPSEAELIQGATSGDREAFCRLAQTYERRLFQLALYYCRNAEDAEDLSQEVWLKAYRSINSFRGQASFYTWLRRIAINTFLNHQRDAKAAANQNAIGVKADMLPLDEACELPDRTTRSVEEALHQRQLLEQVTGALAELTAQQRLIFLLKHREEMSVEEIAEACGVSGGTVKKSLFRAVQKIRERLGVENHRRENAKLAVGETS
jgi:RNA polymerase sigma-70 factor (ECF subfamily)